MSDHKSATAAIGLICHPTQSGECPDYPQPRTLSGHARTSEMCQKATYAVQQIAAYSISSSATNRKAP